MTKIEMKRFNVPFELKELKEDDDYYYFSGYASTFGNIDRGGDVVVAGAFKESLLKMSPVMLWQHDSNEPIGSFPTAYEDDKGLFVEGKMPKADTLVSGRVYPQLKAKSVKAMSIGYSIDNYEIVDDIWYLKAVTLWEVSLVTFPMNPQATVDSVKSIDNIHTERDAEKFLQEFLSANKSKFFISKIKEVYQREVDEKERNREDCNNIVNEIKQITKGLK